MGAAGRLAVVFLIALLLLPLDVVGMAPSPPPPKNGSAQKSTMWRIFLVLTISLTGFGLYTFSKITLPVLSYEANGSQPNKEGRLMQAYRDKVEKAKKLKADWWQGGVLGRHVAMDERKGSFDWHPTGLDVENPRTVPVADRGKRSVPPPEHQSDDEEASLLQSTHLTTEPAPEQEDEEERAEERAAALRDLKEGEESRRISLLTQEREDRWQLARERDVGRQQAASRERERLQVHEKQGRGKLQAAEGEGWAPLDVQGGELTRRCTVLADEAEEWGCVCTSEEEARALVSCRPLLSQLQREEAAERQSVAQEGSEVIALLCALATLGCEEAVGRMSVALAQSAGRMVLHHLSFSTTLALLQQKIWLGLQADFTRMTVISHQRSEWHQLMNAEAAERRHAGTIRMWVALDGAVVRESQAMKSKTVAKMPVNSTVEVSEVVRGRAHIVAPVEGWMSVSNQLGERILLSSPAPSDVPSSPSASSVSNRHDIVTPPRTAAASPAGRSTPTTLSLSSPVLVEVSKESTEVLGLVIVEGSPLVVQGVRERSCAARHGLHGWVGHRLVAINGAPVSSLADIVPFAREESLTLAFTRSQDPGWDGRMWHHPVPLSPARSTSSQASHGGSSSSVLASLKSSNLANTALTQLKAIRQAAQASPKPSKAARLKKEA